MTSLHGYDPRTASPIDYPVRTTSAQGLNEAINGAQASSVEWARRARSNRADALDAVAHALDTAAEELVAIADRETALGPPRLRGEVARTSGQLRMFADLARRGRYLQPILTHPDARTGRPDIRRMLIPRGPIAVFAASNFPFAFSVAGGDTASALAAGCPVIVKAHEAHPHTALHTAEIVKTALHRAGAPSGTFALVIGPDAGPALVKHRGVRAVGFTGSLTGGRALYEIAATRPDPIPFYGELGSINPVIILPGAARERPDQLATGFAQSLTLGVGQYCTNPGLLLVPEDHALLAAIRTAVTATSGGPMLSSRIHDGYVKATANPPWTSCSLLARGSDGPGPWDATPEVRQISAQEFLPDLPRLTDERFGPGSLVVTYPTIKELESILPQLPGSLTATIHASPSEHDTARHLTQFLVSIAGRLIWNDWPTGVAVCWAMHHGGPWPASTAPEHTSVGATAINRWLVPIAYQGFPDPLLPPELQEANPLAVDRTVQP